MTESKPCSTFANCHMTKHVTSKGPKYTLQPQNEIILVSSFQIWYLHNLSPQINTYCKKTQYWNLFWSVELYSDLSPKLIDRKLTF